MNRLISLLHTLSTRVERFRKDEAGITTVEYIILLCLVGLAGIVAWTEFGDTVTHQVNGGRTVR